MYCLLLCFLCINNPLYTRTVFFFCAVSVTSSGKSQNVPEPQSQQTAYSLQLSHQPTAFQFQPLDFNLLNFPKKYQVSLVCWPHIASYGGCSTTYKLSPSLARVQHLLAIYILQFCMNEYLSVLYYFGNIYCLKRRLRSLKFY